MGFEKYYLCDAAGAGGDPTVCDVSPVIDCVRAPLVAIAPGVLEVIEAKKSVGVSAVYAIDEVRSGGCV